MSLTSRFAAAQACNKVQEIVQVQEFSPQQKVSESFAVVALFWYNCLVRNYHC